MWQPTILLLLLLILSTSLLATASLDSISPIPQDEVSPNCFNAFSIELPPNCSPPGPCQASCQPRLIEIGSIVKLKCAQYGVLNPVLHGVLNGEIVDLVCRTPKIPALPQSITNAAANESLVADGKLNKAAKNGDLVLDTTPEPTASTGSGKSYAQGVLVIEDKVKHEKPNSTDTTINNSTGTTQNPPPTWSAAAAAANATSHGTLQEIGDPLHGTSAAMTNNGASDSWLVAGGAAVLAVMLVL
jgi:hypothetical protein